LTFATIGRTLLTAVELDGLPGCPHAVPRKVDPVTAFALRVRILTIEALYGTLNSRQFSIRSPQYAKARTAFTAIVVVIWRWACRNNADLHAQTTRDIGMRVALGAQNVDVIQTCY